MAGSITKGDTCTSLCNRSSTSGKISTFVWLELFAERSQLSRPPYNSQLLVPLPLQDVFYCGDDSAAFTLPACAQISPHSTSRNKHRTRPCTPSQPCTHAPHANNDIIGIKACCARHNCSQVPTLFRCSAKTTCIARQNLYIHEKQPPQWKMTTVIWCPLLACLWV